MAWAQERSSATPDRIDKDACSNPGEFYPRVSKLMNEVGKSLLYLKLNYEGEVSVVRVEKSSGHQRLDDAAIALLKSCAVTPRMLDKKPNKDVFVEVTWPLGTVSLKDENSGFISIGRDSQISILPACDASTPTSQWDKCLGEDFFPTGASYVGEYHQGNWSGRGVWTRSTGSYFVGSFLEGFPDGEGIHYSHDNVVLASGRWKKGSLVTQALLDPAKFAPKETKINPLSKLRRCAGKNFSAPCFGSIEYRATGFYIGEWRSGQREGMGLRGYGNGEKYVGDFRNNCMNGKGVEYFSEGASKTYKFVGEYANCARQGFGSLIYPDGARFVGYFRNGLISGEGIMYDRGGMVIASGKWASGVLVSESRLEQKVDLEAGSFPFDFSENLVAKQTEKWGLEAEADLLFLTKEARRIEEKIQLRRQANGRAFLKVNAENWQLIVPFTQSSNSVNKGAEDPTPEEVKKGSESIQRTR